MTNDLMKMIIPLLQQMRDTWKLNKRKHKGLVESLSMETINTIFPKVPIKINQFKYVKMKQIIWGISINDFLHNLWLFPLVGSDISNFHIKIFKNFLILTQRENISEPS